MLADLLDHLIRNPRLVVLAAVGIVFTGIYSLLHLPVDLFPGLNLPVVNIITHYPGASPEDVELLLTRPLENELRGLPGLKRLASVSIQGVSRITVEFAPGLTVEQARGMVQARLARAAEFLPPGVTPRLENLGTTLQEVAGYVVYGPRDLVTLRRLVRLDITGRLMRVPGVSGVEVLGGDEPAFILRVDPHRLTRLGLGLLDLARLLREYQSGTVAGFLTRGGREYVIRGESRFRTLADLRNIYLRGVDGERVPLTAVARISQGVAPRHYLIRGNGHPAVAFFVRKQPGASTPTVVREVDRALKEFRPFLPPGVHLEKFYDQAEIIREARQTILGDLFSGAALAVAVLYLFTGEVIPTLIVALTIPLTLLATLVFLKMLGLSLNVITFSALALAVGMLVDDAIVVTENILRHRESGKGPPKAALEGALEIAAPDAAGTFTTVAAFFPLALVGGLIGLFLRPFGLTISLALLVSLVLSLSLVPALLAWRLPRRRGKSPPAHFLLSSLNSFLSRALDYGFRHPGRMLGIFLLGILLGGWALLRSPVRWLPPVDEGTLLIEYVLPQGTSLQESNRLGETLARLALEIPDVSCVYRRAGSPVLSSRIEGVNRGELLIKLKPRRERRESLSRILNRLRRAYGRIPGVIFLYHQPTQEKMDESLSGLPALFGVTLYGPDLKTLTRLAQRVERLLERDPAIQSVYNPLKIQRPQVVVRLRYADLARLGVEPQEALATLRAAFWGLEVTRIVQERTEIQVLIRLDLPRPLTPREIGNLPVRTSKGYPVPLSRIADIRVVHIPGKITRLNGQRAVTLVAEVEGPVWSVARRIQKHLRQISLPPGYRTEVSGQYRILRRSLSDLALILIGAVSLIYLLLWVEFRSWWIPLIILVTGPFSLAGALILLWLTGEGLNVSVAMGVITLLGIGVNNAIVLVDFAQRRIEEGFPPPAALREAVRIRLRPVLLTSLTTILALVPAALGLGAGAEFFHGFALTLIGGLLSATPVSLILVPCLLAWGTPEKKVPEEPK